jgi:transcriptional regulator with XRE-family HTH domain
MSDRDYLYISCRRYGEIIKVERQKAGFSQRDLSKFSGVAQQTISVVENGKMMPSLKLLDSIGCALDVNFVLVCSNPTRQNSCSI